MAADEVVVEAQFRDNMSRPLKHATKQVENYGRELGKVALISGTKLGRALDKTRTTLGRVERAMGRVVRGAGRMTVALGRRVASGARTGALALGAITVAAAIAASSLVNLARDAIETRSKFNTVFGETADAVESWVDGVHRQFGIARTDLRDAASMFGVFGKAAEVAGTELPGFSTSLAQAGLDLASFYNEDPTAVFDALRSGLSGEAEPLKRFGIFLSDATMKTQAATMGLTGELSEAQKVMVRHRLIMGSLGDAAGDLARTQEDLAAQQREAAGRWQELREVVGTALIPTYLRLYGVINARLGPITERLGKTIGDLADPVKAADRSIDGWAAQIDYVLGTGGSLLDLVQNSRDRFEEFRPAIDKVGEVTADVATIWNDLLAPAFDDVRSILPFVVSPLTLLDDVLGFVADNADTLYPLVLSLTAAWAGYRTVTLLAAAATATANGGIWLLNAALAANPVGLVVAALALLVTALVVAYRRSETFRIKVQGVFSAVKIAGLTLAKVVIGALKAMVNFFLSAAEDMIGGAARVAEALGMDSLAGKLRDAQSDLTAFKDGANARLGEIETNLDIQISTTEAEQKIRELGSSLNRLSGQIGYVDAAVRSRVLANAGDTATPRTRGGDGATHAALAATMGRFQTVTRGTSGLRVTSGVRDFALGSPGSDHARGRAIDVQGPYTGRLAQQWRESGGFAEHHGEGAGRHLHLAAGDTARPRGGTAPTGGTVVTFGDIIIQGAGADPSEVAKKVRRELVAAVRDAVEGR